MKKKQVLTILLMFCLLTTLERFSVYGDSSVIIDSYSDYDAHVTMSKMHPSATASESATGQTFTVPSDYYYNITSVKFYMQKRGSPTGSAHVYLYTMTGTYGVSGVPTGSPLATVTVDISTIPTNLEWVTFSFNASNQYSLQPNGTYAIAWVNPTSGTVDGTNCAFVGIKWNNPAHSGNYFEYQYNNWVPNCIDHSVDLAFYVYGVITGPVVYRELTILSTPNKVPFTINGTDKETPYSESLLVGNYAVNFSNSFVRSGATWTFRYWDDNLTNTNSHRTINLENDATYSVTYTSNIVANCSDALFAYEMGEFVRSDSSLFNVKQILFDSSRYKNYGVFASSSASPTQVVGRLGYGLMFDGINDYVNVTNSASMQLWYLETISCWIYPMKLNSTQIIIQKNLEYSLSIETDNTFQFSVYDGTNWYSVNSTTKVELNNWCFLVGELNESSVNIYVNNVLEASTPYSAIVTTTSNGVYIGSNGTAWFRGILDELQGYHKLLSYVEKTILSITQISMPPNYIFTTGSGTYGFYNNHFEEPYASNVAYAEVDWFIMGFQTFHSAITINQTGGVGASSYFEWAWSFYKAGVVQVVYQLDIEYMNLANKTVTLSFSRYLPKTGSTLTYKTVSLDLNGTGAYATAWKISVDACVYVDQKSFLVRVLSDTQTQRVTDTTGAYWWEYYFPLLNCDGNAVELTYYDPYVKMTNYLKAGSGVTVSIPSHTDFAWLVAFAIIVLILSITGIGVAVYTLLGGNVASIPIIGGAVQAVSNWIGDLANAIGSVLKPIGTWIVNAFIATLQPIFNSICSVLMSVWSGFVGLMDSVFTSLGWTNGFTAILNVFYSFLSWFTTSLSYVLQLGTSLITFIANGLSVIASYFVGLFNALGTFYNDLVWIWNGTLPYWWWIPQLLTQILPLLFLLWILWCISPLFGNRSISGGIEGTKRNFENTLGYVVKAVMLLWRIVDFTIGLISKLLEAIPVVE